MNYGLSVTVSVSVPSLIVRICNALTSANTPMPWTDSTVPCIETDELSARFSVAASKLRTRSVAVVTPRMDSLATRSRNVEKSSHVAVSCKIASVSLS